MSEKTKKCTIAVDVMGSDRGPTEFIRALIYLKSKNTLRSDLILVGQKKLLERLIDVKKKELQTEHIHILDATEVPIKESFNG